MGKTASVEKEKDEAKEKAQNALLTVVTTVDVKAMAEDKLARVQDAMAATEEASWKVKAEVVILEVEQTSLLLEIGTANDEASSFHYQAGKDKEAMEED